MNRIRLIGATVALALIVITGQSNAGVEWTRSAKLAGTPPPDPKAPIAWFNSHVQSMRAAHPHGKWERTGYEYMSATGQDIYGIQVRLAGPDIQNPCYFLAVWTPSGHMNAGSCSGN